MTLTGHPLAIQFYLELGRSFVGRNVSITTLLQHEARSSSDLHMPKKSVTPLCEGELREKYRNMNHQPDIKQCLLTDPCHSDTFTTNRLAHNGQPQGNRRAVAR